MEPVAHDQLQKYVLENILTSCRQSGFRPVHSTADLVNILSQKWNQHHDNEEEVVVIALDIKRKKPLTKCGVMASIQTQGKEGFKQST